MLWTSDLHGNGDVAPFAGLKRSFRGFGNDRLPIHHPRDHYDFGRLFKVGPG